MNIKQILIMAAAGIMLAACQSKGYQIKGTAEEFENGDTLFLTTDAQGNTPRDTLIVQDGKFALNGETDSTYICMIYSAKNENIGIPFFIEPGTIKVLLSKEPNTSQVGGTYLNEELQRMNDAAAEIGREINNIAEKAFADGETTEEDQQRVMKQVEELHEQFNEIVRATTTRNIKNELGYYLLTMYPPETFSDKQRMELIRQLPAEMRKRDIIKEMEAYLNEAAKTAEGTTITDFTMPSLGETPLSVMSEVKKNRITILDFWASWCGPCRQEMPVMVEIYKKYKDKGLGFVGISLDEDADAWKQATEQLGIVWPQMSDLKGWDNMAARMFNINSIPHTIVLDQNGKILHRGLRGKQLEEFIADELK